MTGGYSAPSLRGWFRSRRALLRELADWKLRATLLADVADKALISAKESLRKADEWRGIAADFEKQARDFEEQANHWRQRFEQELV